MAYQTHSLAPLVNRDEEHLRLLAIFHFVVGGFNLLALLVFIILPLVIGPAYYAALHMPLTADAMPMVQKQLVGGLIVGSLQTLIYGLNGWSMQHRRNRISCLILSIIECVSIPLGLMLGVSAILVLRRATVKALFAPDSTA